MLKNALLWVGFFALLCFFVAPVMAQTKTLTGKVTDSKTGAPLAGVSIMPKGSKFAITTDTSGGFTIYVRPSTGILVATYPGYFDIEIDVTILRPLDVRLQKRPIAQSGMRVVSVGYDTLKQKDIAVQATNINSKNFNTGAVINPASQIQGKVAGVVVTMAGGDPNALATIHVRGQTSITGDQSPLFVVDGIALDDAAQFQNIPPEDIESYDVLKDASATAIYGSRGANGVIIVNTKKGHEGKILIEYNGYAGVDRPGSYYDLLNTNQYKQALSTFNGSDYDKGGNTDWQKAILRTAVIQSNNIAVSGGSKNITFRGSANYQDNQGVVMNSDKQQLGFSFNAEGKTLDNRLNITAGILNISTKHKYVNYDLFTDVINNPPTYPIYNTDGSFYDFTGAGQGNAVELAQQPYNSANEYQTLVNASADYAILHYLRIGVTGSATRHNTQTHYYDTQISNNGASDGNFNQDYYSGNIHLDFDKKMGKHNLFITGVYEYNNYTNNSFGAGSPQYLVPGNMHNIGIADTINTTKHGYKLTSFLARVNYNYNEIFYATASLRRDHSTNFGVNNQWGNFPSVDIAIRLKKVLFNDQDWIQDLKIRAGYGVVGNQNAIGPYSSEVLRGTTIYGPNQNMNPDLKWEERQGRNIGAEISLFDNRFIGDVNVYSDLTTNFLYNYTVPAPPFLYSNIIANVGRLVNQGVEMSFTAELAQSEDFNWNISGNINIPDTKITRLSGTYGDAKLITGKIPVGYALGYTSNADLGAAPITFFKTNVAPYEFYLPHFTGFDAQGNQLFDGKTLQQDAHPKKYFINPAEKLDYGLGNSLSYKNWSLTFFFRGVYGQKIFNNTLLDYGTVTRLPGNNIIAKALSNNHNDIPTVSDRWLENASYLRLDNASLGYSFKQIRGINSLRIYIATNNLFVITKYKGLDPEVQVADNNQAYIDANYNGSGYYPKTRSFIIGANVSFK